MFDANMLMAVQKEFDLSSVPPLAIAQYILFKTPSFLNQTFPVGMALAASLATNRIARESELTAMRTAGASILRFLIPIVAFGVVVAGINLVTVEIVMPRAEQRAAVLQQKIGALVTAPSLAENAYIRLDRFQVSIGQVQRIGQNQFQLKDVLLFSRPKPGVDQIVSSPSGTYNNGVWTFDKAVIRQVKGDSLVQISSDSPMQVDERIVVGSLFAPPQPEALSLGQLKNAISQGLKSGVDVGALQVEYQTRFSVPAACIVFAFVAPCLAIAFSKSGGFAGVLLSIFIVFLYYNTYVVSALILGKNHDLPPVLGAWLPNILFLVVGFWVLRRLE